MPRFALCFIPQCIVCNEILSAPDSFSYRDQQPQHDRRIKKGGQRLRVIATPVSPQDPWRGCLIFGVVASSDSS
jgi:hypothetical protein